MPPHQRVRHVIIGILAALTLPASALATEAEVCPVCGQMRDPAVTYQAKAGHTLVRGAANTLFGWTELIRQPAAEAKGGGNVFAGIAKGVGQGLRRTVGGVGELLTFWTPKVQDNYLQFSHDCPLCVGQSRVQAPAPQTPQP